jgi:hypothetical protein
MWETSGKTFMNCSWSQSKAHEHWLNKCGQVRG